MEFGGVFVGQKLPTHPNQKIKPLASQSEGVKALAGRAGISSQIEIV